MCWVIWVNYHHRKDRFVHCHRGHKSSEFYGLVFLWFEMNFFKSKDVLNWVGSKKMKCGQIHNSHENWARFSGIDWKWISLKPAQLWKINQLTIDNFFFDETLFDVRGVRASSALAHLTSKVVSYYIILYSTQYILWINFLVFWSQIQLGIWC